MKILKREKINTTNGWGFGGMTGIKATYENGYFKIVGTSHFRHAPSKSVCNYYNNDCYPISKEVFEEATK